MKASELRLTFADCDTLLWTITPHLNFMIEHAHDFVVEEDPTKYVKITARQYPYNTGAVVFIVHEDDELDICDF